MNALIKEEMRALRKIARLLPTLSRASRNWLITHLHGATPLTPEDSLWLAILAREPSLTRADLEAGGFPQHLIKAALAAAPPSQPSPRKEK